MTGSHVLKEDLELKKARQKIRKIQENESCTGGTSRKIKLDKRMHRNVKYIVEPESGYWKCGEMKCTCQFCLELHFLGEENSQTGSTLANPRFSECCSSGQVTLHFLLMSSCVQCLETLRDKEGLSRHPHPGKACSSCGHVVPKIIPTFPEPPTLLRQLLTSKSAEARHFRKNIRYYNSAMAMASV